MKKLYLKLINLCLAIFIVFLLSQTVLTVATPHALWKATKGPTNEEKKIITYEVKSEFQGSEGRGQGELTRV